MEIQSEELIEKYKGLSANLVQDNLILKIQVEKSFKEIQELKEEIQELKRKIKE